MLGRLNDKTEKNTHGIKKRVKKVKKCFVISKSDYVGNVELHFIEKSILIWQSTQYLAEDTGNKSPLKTASQFASADFTLANRHWESDVWQGAL